MKINNIVRSTFALYDADGDRVSGEAANFAKTLYRDGAATGESVTITEILSTGLYMLSFTPTSTGWYSTLVTHATYNPEGWIAEWEILNHDADSIATEIATITGKLPDDDIAGSSDKTSLESRHGGASWEGTAPSNIANAVWDALTAGHITANSFAEALKNILKIEKNKWEILNNQMIFYDDDNSTPLFTFDLKNKRGAASSRDIFSRNPV